MTGQNIFINKLKNVLMESYNWKISENKIDPEASKAERRIYWIFIISFAITIVLLIRDNLQLRDDKVNYTKHQHQYNVHKDLENEQ